MTADASGPALLVVDDNEDNRYTLVQRLRRLGYTDIVTAVDGNTDASPSRVRHLIHSHKTGETVTFTILRQGKPQTIAVTVK